MRTKFQNWKGYVWVHKPDHPRATNAAGYVKRCVLVVEERLGRFLSRNEDVHHKNENKSDDRDENLEVLSHAEHARRHIKVADKCANCGGPHHARGLCSPCYGKFYRAGKVMPLAPSRRGRWNRKSEDEREAA